MNSYKRNYTLISELYALSKGNASGNSLEFPYSKSSDIDSIINTSHRVKARIRNAKLQSGLTFLHIYDGSCTQHLQIVFEDDTLITPIQKDLVQGAYIEVVGTIVLSPAKGQLFEMKADKITIKGRVYDPSTSLYQGRPNLETLRPYRIDRMHFKTFQSAFRITSTLSKLTHNFMHENKMLHIDPHTITSSDCEGAGEVFHVTTLLKDGDVSKIPTIDGTTNIDFSKDFFLKKSYLTVSSQLEMEALCSAFGGVYTTNKSYRAEPSKTSRHLAEFTHIEVEDRYDSLDDLMNFIEAYVVYCISNVLKECEDDIKELSAFVSPNLYEKLKSFIQEPFIRIPYDDVIELCKKDKSKITKLYTTKVNIDNKVVNKLPDIPVWGDDIPSCVERYLFEEIYKKPVFITEYPRDLKAFYMRPNTVREDGKQTVQNCDLICQYEIVGGSMRDNSYESLMDEITKRKIDTKPLEWYIDLRKKGGSETGGFGLGFNRLVSLCTGIPNIKDVTPFYVAYEQLM